MFQCQDGAEEMFIFGSAVSLRSCNAQIKLLGEKSKHFIALYHRIVTFLAIINLINLALGSLCNNGRKVHLTSTVLRCFLAWCQWLREAKAKQRRDFQAANMRAKLDDQALCMQGQAFKGLQLAKHRVTSLRNVANLLFQHQLRITKAEQHHNSTHREELHGKAISRHGPSVAELSSRGYGGARDGTSHGTLVASCEDVLLVPE
eukprot:Skav234161  [mRNA]  locus=scaffold572:68190:70471:+ [translate_table: standard]